MFLQFAYTVNPEAVQFLAAIDEFRTKPKWDRADKIVHNYFWSVPGINLNPAHVKLLQNEISKGMLPMGAEEQPELFEWVRQIILQTLAGLFPQFKAQMTKMGPGKQ